VVANIKGEDISLQQTVIIMQKHLFKVVGKVYLWIIATEMLCSFNAKIIKGDLSILVTLPCDLL
jgi:hypothetical protein